MPYTTVNAILTANNSEMSAAQAHGMATGMMVGDKETRAESWLTELLCDNDSGEFSDSDLQVLTNLYNETQRLLQDEEFGFGLLLPDEDAPLKYQANAVKDWCQGFLFGLGSRSSGHKPSREAKEILKDLAEFTKLDVEAEGEEDESALVEIIEYVRAAVLMLQDEFGGDSNSQGDGFETD